MPAPGEGQVWRPKGVGEGQVGTPGGVEEGQVVEYNHAFLTNYQEHKSGLAGCHSVRVLETSQGGAGGSWGENGSLQIQVSI